MSDWKSFLHTALFAIWRRKWIALGVAWLVCVVGWGAVILIPSSYQARTRVFVDTESMLSPLLKGMAVETNVAKQVEVMQRTLLSRPNIEKVLRSNDLDRDATSPERRQALVELMEKRISIRPEAAKNLFTIEYSASNPETARKVIQSFLTIFIESNVGTQRKDMERAQSFIAGQVVQHEHQLKEAEARLTEFKEKYRDVLPGALGGEGSFSAILARAREQLMTTRRELDDMTTRAASLSRQLATIPRFLDVGRRTKSSASRLASDGPNARVAEAEDRLTVLRTRFTERHPDVIAARRVVEQARKQRGEVQEVEPSSDGSSERISNPVYEQLQVRFSDASTSVEALQRRLAMEKKELEKLESMSQTIPKIEAEYADLTRGYGLLKKNYSELQERQESAKLSQEVDAKAENVSFRVIEPPITPAKPSFPNRPLLASIVFVVGIGAGLVVAYGLFQLDDSFSSVKAVRGILPYPVIGAVSLLVSPEIRRRNRRGALKFSMACVCLLLAFGAVTMLTFSNAGESQLMKYRNLIQL